MDSNSNEIEPVEAKKILIRLTVKSDVTVSHRESTDPARRKQVNLEIDDFDLVGTLVGGESATAHYAPPVDKEIKGDDPSLPEGIRSAIHGLSGRCSAQYTLEGIPASHGDKSLTSDLEGKTEVTREAWPIQFSVWGTKDKIDALKEQIKRFPYGPQHTTAQKSAGTARLGKITLTVKSDLSVRAYPPDESGREVCVLQLGRMSFLCHRQAGDMFFQASEEPKGDDPDLPLVLRSSLGDRSGYRAAHYKLQDLLAEHNGTSLTAGLAEGESGIRKAWPIRFTATGRKGRLAMLKSSIENDSKPAGTSATGSLEELLQIIREARQKDGQSSKVPSE